MIKISELGDFLKQLRGNKSLRDIERSHGISHTYLSSLEKGADPRTGKERKPTPETLSTLSEAYNHPYNDLMARAGYLEDVIQVDDPNTYLGATPGTKGGTIKVIFNEVIFDVEKTDNDDILVSSPPSRFEVVNRFYDIGYILKNREKALCDGRTLDEPERKKILAMLKTMFSANNT